MIFFFRFVSIYKSALNTTKQFSHLIFTIQQPRSEAKTRHMSHFITLIQIYFTKSPLCSSKVKEVNVDIHAVVLSVPRERDSPIHTLQKLFPRCGVNQKAKTPAVLYATKLVGRVLMKYFLNFDVFPRYVGCITLKARKSHTKNGIFNVKIT